MSSNSHDLMRVMKMIKTNPGLEMFVKHSARSCAKGLGIKMTIINPQVALQRRDGSVDRLHGTLFEAVTAAQDDCKSRSLWSPKRIMSVGIIRKNGKYKPMRWITVDPAPQPPKTCA